MMSIQQFPQDSTMDVIEDHSLQLSSPAFSAWDEIPQKYTFLGENINPPLTISNVPRWCKRLILIMEDIDARQPFVNWLVYDIDPEILSIDEDTTPGKVATNSVGQQAYYGPTPTQGIHYYKFTIYAVDEYTEITGKISPQELHTLLMPSICEKAELIGKVTTTPICAIE